MKLRMSTYTNKGGMSINEDSIKAEIVGSHGVFVLADGLGGHGHGNLASTAAVEAAYDHLSPLTDITGNDIADAFYEGQLKILELQENLGSMRSTIVALDISGDFATWGYIGDSRIYYINGNRITYVSKDHSVTYKKYLSKEISYMDIYHDEDRNRLLNVLGNKDKFRPAVMEEPLRLDEGDAFLLCSDGFWEYVYDNEVLIDFLKAESPEKWIEYMLLRHIARIRPNNDNFSVIAVFCEED